MAEENNSKFGSGFVVGSLIGAGAVFLLGTKKGKKLLKALTEEGFDGVSELFGGELEGNSSTKRKRLTPRRAEKKILKTVNKVKNSEPVVQLSDKIEEIKDSEVVQNLEEKIEPVIEQVSDQTQDAIDTVSKKAKRFFKGIRK